MNSEFTGSCPLPISNYPQIVMAHGGGGRIMQQLIEQIFVRAFNNDLIQQGHDSTRLNPPNGDLAFTTDSFVINPLFFPGGDIGSLSIHGTCNDLAMSGARPLYLSCGFILEEGFSVESLCTIVDSMRKAALEAGAKIVTGDTKVVERGKGDGLFINTSGVGVIEHPWTICPSRIKPGDAILVSGDLGRHGITIMSIREGLGFETSIQSDAAFLWPAVEALLKAGIEIHCLRDLTRGGLASALNELAQASRTQPIVHERKVPVCDEVRGACEILGFDPFYVANEGRFVVIVPQEQAAQALAVLRSIEVSREAALIGDIGSAMPGRVSLKSQIGAERILDMLSGEQLPRIC